MKRSLKRLSRCVFTLLLTFALCLGAIPEMTVVAASPIPGHNVYAGKVTKKVGEDGIYQRLPRVTNVCPTYQWVVLSEYIPNTYDNRKATYANDIISGDYVIGEYAERGDYEGLPCLEFDFTAIKPGSTSVNLYFEYGYYYHSETGWGSCGHRHTISGNWNTYYDTVNFNVTVNADYVLNYNTRGGHSSFSNDQNCC